MDNRYPTIAQLRKIENFNGKTAELIEYVRSIWWMADWGFKVKGKKVLYLELHCGGWSGNEDIIDALQRNYFFWSMHWSKTLCGGHYYFKIKEVSK